MDEIRPLAAEVGVLPRVHGSGLFTRGQTQVLSICTLSIPVRCSRSWTPSIPEESKRWMHHYNYARLLHRRSPGPAAPPPAARSVTAHLAEKALAPVLPSVEEFPYAIRVVSEVLSSNGSTSQGSICGSTLALMDAGVPIKRPVAGISCGLISDGVTSWRTFIDIQGVEDFHGEMDFKVAGTVRGRHRHPDGPQERRPDHGDHCRRAGELTRKARLEILDQIMLPCIAEPREEVSEYAPKMISMKIPVEKIREVIGSGGKTIQKITAETGAKIDIDDDGSIFISAVDASSCKAAKKLPSTTSALFPRWASCTTARSSGSSPSAPLWSWLPGKDGMVHISKLENHRVEKVEDVLNVGDMTWVKVTDIDEKGRVNLSAAGMR